MSLKSELQYTGLITLFVGYSFAYSQVNVIETNVKILQTTSNDSTRIMALKKLSEIYRDSNQVKSIEYAMELSQLAEKLSNDKARFYSFELLGTVYSNVGKYDKALKYFDSAGIVVKKINYELGEVTLSNQKGKLYAMQGAYEKAISCFTLVLRYFTLANDSLRVAKSLNNIGNIYFEIFKYEKALSFYNKSLQYKNVNLDPVGYATTLNNISEVLVAQNKYEEAIAILNRCLSINSEQKSKDDIALVYVNLGDAYLKINRFERAIISIEKAIQLYSELDDYDGLVTALHVQGKIYERMNNFEAAQKSLLKSLRIASENGMNANRADILLELYKLNRRLNRLEKAIYYYESHIAIRDSIMDKKKIDLVNETINQFEVESKVKEVELLKAMNNSNLSKIKRIEITFALVSLTLLTVLFLLFVFYYRWKMRANLNLAKIQHDLKDQEVKNMEIDKKNIQFKLLALRLQMNPHFIFNALNSIQGLIISDETKLAFKYLSKFSKLLRHVLEYSEESSVSLRRELETLELYLEIEQMRFKNDFQFSIVVDPIINRNDLLVPCMLLQPIVENSLKHGLLLKVGIKRIDIYITTVGDMIRYIVEDNGIGRDEAKTRTNYSAEKSQSKGTQIIQERLNVISAQSKLNIIDLFVNGVAAGTRVDIQFPAKAHVRELDAIRFIKSSRLFLET